MQLTSIQDITTKYRHIFLAPHFDDVVFSCGGTLGVQVSSGLRPLVVTVFGGVPASKQSLSPFASQVISEWNLGSDPAQIVKARQQEDLAALEHLQCDALTLNYQEAIYRGNPAYYTSLPQLIGGNVHKDDQNIANQLSQTLLDLQSRLPDVAWYAPLGIGRHVDHQIVYNATQQLLAQGAKVYYYEDFPYVQREQGSLSARLKELGGAFEFALVEMSEMHPIKVEAADMYASQINSNFGSKEAMHQALEQYTHSIRPVETVQLERYWTAR